MASRFWRLTMSAMAALLSGAALPRDAAHAQAPVTATQEDAAWAAALESNSLEAYENYLRENPTGDYASEAFRRIVAISRGLSPAGALELGAEIPADDGAPAALTEIY